MLALLLGAKSDVLSAGGTAEEVGEQPRIVRGLSKAKLKNPCQMFGQCLNCEHLMCVKGAHGRLDNIRSELNREKDLRAKAAVRQEEGLRINPRWLELYDRKIVRLEQLIQILENDEIVDGSPVFLSNSIDLPQFDPIAFGKSGLSSLPEN